MVIRRLESQDVASFLAWRGGDSYKNNAIMTQIQEHFEGKRVKFVATADGLIAGTVQFVPFHADPALGDAESVGYLQALEVRPEYRGQGLGTRLVQAVEAEAVAGGFRRLSLMVEPDNAAALALCRRPTAGVTGTTRSIA